MTTKQLFGTMCAVIALLFATGETLTNGLLAVVFMGVAVLCLKDYAATEPKVNGKLKMENGKLSARKAA